MCYSALVLQNAKKMGLSYKMRVQKDLYDDLFRARLDGHKMIIPRAMERSFLEKPKDVVDLRIAGNIRKWRNEELVRLKTKVKKQEKRLHEAEKKLTLKVTKKAEDDQRISTTKLVELRKKIETWDEDNGDDYSRIYSGSYASLITHEKGEGVIRPFRYLLRPNGQTDDFDRKFSGSYNARRDRLKEVFWWKSIYGKNHGALVIQAFYEWVEKDKKKVILKFSSESLPQMEVPCIWDRNTADGFTLDSFALITDEPNPEVAAAGHDRTPVIMKHEYLNHWLATGGKDLTEYETIFEDKQPTYFKHTQSA